MGEIISIREKAGDDRFRIGYSTTGEERIVSLDPDKRDLYYLQPALTEMACPFLRERQPGIRICTVHLSHPDLCRDYKCFRLLILSGSGEQIGRIIDGTRFLLSADPGLNRIWQDLCTSLVIDDEYQWEETVKHILSCKGFKIVG